MYFSWLLLEIGYLYTFGISAFLSSQCPIIYDLNKLPKWFNPVANKLEDFLSVRI